jgi:hypothetical protein
MAQHGPAGRGAGEYLSLFVSDRYLGDGPVIRAVNHRVVTLAAIPAISVAAEATTTLRDLYKTGSSNLTGMGLLAGYLACSLDGCGG